MNKRISAAAALTLGVACAPAALAASVADLAWMTGTYAGAVALALGTVTA